MNKETDNLKAFFWLVIQAFLAVGLAYLLVQLEQKTILAFSAILPNSGFLYFIPTLLLGIAFFLPQLMRWPFLSLSGFLYSFAVLGDLVYFRYFDTLPSFSSKIPIIQAWTVRGSFIQLTTVGELLTPALFLLTLVFAVIFHKFGAKWQFQNKRLRWIPQLMGVMLILLAFRFQTVAYRTPIKADPSEPRHKESVLPVQQWAIENSPIYKAKTFGLFLFHYQDWRRSQSLKAQPLSEAQLISLRQNLDHIYDVNQTSTPYFGLAKNCNVLFIQLEAFQEFLIDLTVDGTEVTPFLNQLKKRCLYWDHIYDVTYIGRTSDAEFIVHTGLYCDHAGASAFIHLDKDLITFPRLLKQAGYQTASIHGFHKDFWNRAHSHPFFGIDHLYFDQELQSQESLGLGLADKAVFSESVALMKSFNQPFYTLMISLTNHHPFSDYPKEYAEKFQGVSRFNANYLRTEYNKLKPGPELKSSMKFNTNYLRTANYTDDALRQLFSDLKDAGILDTTLIVIYGDHDLGYLSPNSDPKIIQENQQDFGLNPYEAPNDKVPLFVIVPKMELPNDMNSFAPTGSLADLFPTVFHLLGLQTPFGIFGQNLLVNDPEKIIPLPASFDFSTRTKSSYCVTSHAVLQKGNSLIVHPFDEPIPETKGPESILNHAEEIQKECEGLIRNNLQIQLRPKAEVP